MIKWEKHPVYDKYLGSTDGRIKSTYTGKNLSFVKDGDGYLKTTLKINKKNKTVRAHRFIYECFNGIMDNSLQINHKNGDKENNSIFNIEAVSQSVNMQHAYKSGLNKNIGINHHKAKLTFDEVCEIRRLREKGYRISMLSIIYCCGESTIRNIVQFKNRKFA